MTTVDLDRIKSDIAIDWLIGQTLTVVGSGHTLTTEEHDSLKIFTRNNSWTWYSQLGRDGKALGGTVIDWYMHVHQCGTAEAIRSLSLLLEGGTLAPAPKTFVAKQKVEAWKAERWQNDARCRLEAAQAVLLDDGNLSGAPGREYLTDRGISPAMWLAWGLGYGNAWNNAARRAMPAVWIPWMNRQITAIQYRFLGVEKDAVGVDRFGQLRGGRRYLCGLHLCCEAEPGQLDTLFLVEGELNAISLLQAVYGLYPVDVVSYGPQGNINNPDVARMAAAVAERYRNVIVWADEPEFALKAVAHLPNNTIPLRSPGGQDANDLLRAGLLDDVIYELIRRTKQG